MSTPRYEIRPLGPWIGPVATERQPAYRRRLRRWPEHERAENDLDLPGLYAAVDSARAVMAFSSRDWSEAGDCAWLWGIFQGWGPDDEDPDDREGAWREVADRYGWGDATLDRLRSLHAAVQTLMVGAVAPPVPDTRTTPAPADRPRRLLKSLLAVVADFMIGWHQGRQDRHHRAGLKWLDRRRRWRPSRSAEGGPIPPGIGATEPDVPAEALEVGDQVAFTLPPSFTWMTPRRLTGEVIRVHCDGLVTVQAPQENAPPMEVTAPAAGFTRVRTSPDVEAAFARGVAAGRTQAAADMAEYCAGRVRAFGAQFEAGVLPEYSSGVRAAWSAAGRVAERIAEGSGIHTQEGPDAR